MTSGIALSLALLSCSGSGGGGSQGDPCATDNGGCDPLTTCSSTGGTRTCGACPASYAGTGETGCVEPLACAEAQLASFTSATRSLNVAATCGGTPAVCCPGGTAMDPCGPVVLDFGRVDGDPPRLETTMTDASTLDVVIRARVRTGSPIPVTLPVAGDCTVAGDTAPGAWPDLALSLVLTRVTDATGPHLVVGQSTLAQLEGADVSVGGNAACSVVSVDLVLGLLNETFLSEITSALQPELCAVCPCGT